MPTYLGGLDVVVEVVAESLDVGDDLVSSRSLQMAREEDCTVSILL